MISTCAIVPTRGDRPMLLDRTIDFLLPRLDYYLIDYSPKSNEIDLVPRVKEGIKRASKDGYEFVFIIEDDDYYPGNYFSSYGDLSNIDFVGYSNSIYYNILNRSYEILQHPGRSSLFCTGFRISALDKFNWPNDNEKFLDIKLWEYANRYSLRTLLLDSTIEKYSPIGIKGHGIGKHAGKGHVMQLKYKDPELKWLQSYTDQEAFEFYKNLMNHE